MAEPRQAMAMWPLAFLAGLLPLVAALTAMTLSMQQGLVPTCNPFIEGCTSVSRAGRHGLPNLIFQTLMVPAAVLQALVWIAAAHWLASGQERVERGVRLLVPLGVIAGMALVLYATFLGTDGQAYRWLRRYGTVMYFGCTCLCLLLLGRALQARAARVDWALPRWQASAVVAMAVALPLLGLGNAAVAAWFDEQLKDRVENVTEWWGALIFVLGFFLIAALWRRTGLTIQLATARPRRSID
jgi:xanthine/uracil/vitamin C permease (AzgA family)